MPKDAPKKGAKKGVASKEGAKKEVAKKEVPKGGKPLKKAIDKKGSKKVEKKHVKKGFKYAALLEHKPKSFFIGQDLPNRKSTDLTRFVRFPRYIRIQRQRRVLSQRLKVPPPINQFTNTLTKLKTVEVFHFLSHYRPETDREKKSRLFKCARAKAKGKKLPKSRAHRQIKFGIGNVASLVEKKRAKLVVIANDVDPIEVVVWLPALCRKMEVPYVIVKGKSRLGKLVHRKHATCVAVTYVDKQHKETLQQIVNHAKENYNDNVDIRKKWGGGVLGARSLAKRLKKEKQVAAEQLVLKSNKDK